MHFAALTYIFISTNLRDEPAVWAFDPMYILRSCWTMICLECNVLYQQRFLKYTSLLIDYENISSIANGSDIRKRNENGYLTVSTNNLIAPFKYSQIRVGVVLQVRNDKQLLPTYTTFMKPIITSGRGLWDGVLDCLVDNRSRDYLREYVMQVRWRCFWIPQNQCHPIHQDWPTGSIFQYKNNCRCYPAFEYSIHIINH